MKETAQSMQVGRGEGRGEKEIGALGGMLVFKMDAGLSNDLSAPPHTLHFLHSPLPRRYLARRMSWR